MRKAAKSSRGRRSVRSLKLSWAMRIYEETRWPTSFSYADLPMIQPLYFIHSLYIICLHNDYYRDPIKRYNPWYDCVCQFSIFIGLCIIYARSAQSLAGCGVQRLTFVIAKPPSRVFMQSFMHRDMHMMGGGNARICYYGGAGWLA